MHFTTLFIMKGETLDNVSLDSVEENFGVRFCNSCGETRPRYMYWCDWFQIGGRWNDAEILVADRGIRGEDGIGEGYKEVGYSICEIKDLKEDIKVNMVYAVATKTRVFESGTEGFEKLIDKINKKEIKGVVAVIDCHD